MVGILLISYCFLNIRKGLFFFFFDSCIGIFILVIGIAINGFLLLGFGFTSFQKCVANMVEWFNVLFHWDS
jgi:hypothetical protein